MSKVIPIRRDTVREVLDEIADDMPDQICAFVMKDDRYLVRISNLENVTSIIGALERIKFDLLSGQ